MANHIGKGHSSRLGFIPSNNKITCALVLGITLPFQSHGGVKYLKLIRSNIQSETNLGRMKGQRT